MDVTSPRHNRDVGTFVVPIEVGDPSGERFERIDALVDTGASHTVLPMPLLARLGVVPHARPASSP